MDYLDKTSLICDTVDNGIILLNEDLEVLFWNRWLETRTNISLDEILNKNILDIFPDINKNKLKRKIKAALTLNSPTFYTTEVNESFFNIEYKNKITDRVFYNMQQNVTVTPYDVQKKLVIIYVYDSTMLRETNFKLSRAKQNLEVEHQKVLQIKGQLEESIEEFEFLLNATMEAIVIFNENNQSVNINDVGVELFGLNSKEEGLQKDIVYFFESASLNLNNAAATFEATMRLKNGSTFPALVKLKEADFKERHYKILTIVDLTELKYRDRLISEQAKMAAMGEMIGNIAHQWRQPLSAITTAASGAKLQKEFNMLTDELFNECLDGIVRNSMHLSQTINDFRDFISGDKDIVEFDLEENIRKNISIVESMLKHHKVEVHIEAKSSLKIHNYKNELTQAFLNLIDNAKDALIQHNIKEKYIFIKIYQEGSNAIIKVTDNAKGIPTNIMKKVFEPYFTTKHQSQGTGLGLYMTHQIIEKSMQGSIEVQNTTFDYHEHTFTGATFTITLPIMTKELY
ncbi:ATP-binding protein [Candidatus Marinarcus aquaticus]|uniref:histidine kinase n=1 Tax=Candidatus Marinarcus aquaticus TaxID=2044504 RepID=A0A4V1LP77_9BACT|nr:ATP-binding protein [Candidatus Marinarcus aquaticus]RXJ60238.1 PAS domain-containing sensor histidine kinase [Candidatus Marinarcus aquaticus]